MSTIQSTVYEAFCATRRLYPAHDFLCVLPQTAAKYGIQPRTWSYSAAAVEIARLADRYRAGGLTQGQRVGLLLENRPAFFFHWLALNSLGVSVVPINPEWRSAELEYLVDHAEMRVAVAPAGRLEELRRAGASAGQELIVSTPELESLPGRPGAVATGHPDINTECALLYTSGTTGRPKGCVLPNEYFLWAGGWYAGIGGLCRVATGRERLITPLPMTHMNAMAYSTMVMLLTGGCIVPLDRFHPDTWWATVRESRATIVHYLGVMPAMLLSSAELETDRRHQVRFGFPLLEAWAMTETGAGAVIIANHEPRKVGTACFGRAEISVDWRVVNELGNAVPPGQAGELLVRCAGPTRRYGFFREYLKDPEATAQAWAGDYFHTGDIVTVDSDGDFHFVDRKKNVIRRSGENISAVEVESVLLQHPKVASVGVTAVPDPVRGDEVMACVVPRSDLSQAERTTLAQELQAFCLDRLAYFKAPGYVGFCERLPLTATEKIQRVRLQELGHDLLAAGLCRDLRSLKKRTVAP